MTEFEEWKAAGRVGRIKLNKVPGYHDAADIYYLQDGKLYGKRDKELKGSWSRDPRYPYRQVTLRLKDGGKKHKRKCRIIAAAFVDGHLPGYEVDHIDGNKSNDAPTNLEWVTRAENIRRVHADTKQLAWNQEELEQEGERA